jgi:hypothetical protein
MTLAGGRVLKSFAMCVADARVGGLDKGLSAGAERETCRLTPRSRRPRQSGGLADDR